MSEPVVRTLDVIKRYGEGDSAVLAVSGVTCAVGSGEYVSIVGPSGSGKSTLFNLIGGLDRPTSGLVMVSGADVGRLSSKELAYLRSRSIGYIFQTFNLIEVRTALENVMLPLLIAGEAFEAAAERALALLDQVGLGHRLQHRPSELSGGQQQRVAVARALANAPSLILADEPTGNLDRITGSEIISLLKEMNREHSVTVICATHDAKMLDVSDRVLQMSDGRLTEDPIASG